MNDDRLKFEAALEVTLEAVREQEVLPLLLALGSIAAAYTRNSTAQELAASLRAQAQSCPPDVRGRVYLQALADMLEAPSADPQALARTFARNGPGLRLVSGPEK